MKNILILTKLIFLINCSLLALDEKWQIALDAEFPRFPVTVSSACVGIDGSALLYDQVADTLFWLDSNGTLQEEIINVAGNTNSSLGDSVIVSESFLLVPIKNGSGNDFTKVYQNTESGYSEETVTGSHSHNTASALNSAYYLSYDDSSTQLTVYVLPDFGQSSPSLGVSMVPANAIVIPASFEGDVNVQLQSSLDLVEWTNADSGYFSISNGSPRFFRVKAELK